MTENYQATGPGQYVSQPNINRGFNVLVGAVAVKAAMNWYQLTGDKSVAASKGLGAFVRWMVWAMCWGLCIIAGWMLGNFQNGNYIGMWLTMLVSPFLLGVTWCRHIDYCLFRRGIIYRFFNPIARLVEWCPTWGVYLLVIVPLMSGGGAFSG